MPLSFLRFVASRRGWVAWIGLAALCLAILLFGQRIVVAGERPLGDLAIRGAIVAAILALILAWDGVVWWRAVRADARALRQVLSMRSGSEPDTGEGFADVWRDLTGTLRSDERRFVSRLPCYLLLGPPPDIATVVDGAGLEPAFAASPDGRPGASIVGPWRVWLTREAVLIGGEPGAGEEAAWRDMLAMLRRWRPRRPLDGLILVLPAATVLDADEAETAARLRRRIQDIGRGLRTRVPVYTIVAGCDRLTGFADFFARQDATAAAQPLGIGLAAAGDAREALSGLPARLAALCDAVGRQAPLRAESEADPTVRARIMLFPEQLSRLCERIRAVTETALKALPEPRPLPRAVLFAPGTAAGGPLDAWDRTFAIATGLPGVPPAREAGPGFAALAAGAMRFILPEAGLGGTSTRGEARAATWHGLGYAACAAAALGAIGWTVATYNRHNTQLGAMRTAVRTEASLLTTAQPRNGLDAVLPALDEAARLARLAPEPASAAWGIDPLDIDAARDAASRHYDASLRDLMLPALASELRQQLMTATTTGMHPSKVRALLTTYLMLNDPTHFDRARVSGWATSLIDADLALDAARRVSAQAHLRRLLDAMPLPVTQDQGLIAAARTVIRQQPDADAAYARLKAVAAASTSIPPLDVVAALGATGSQLLMLRSQAGLPVVVPALYTRDGFYRLFLTEAPAIVKGLDANDWILGEPAAAAQADVAAVQAAVNAMYAQDYIRTWQGIVDQVALRALPDLPSLTGGLQSLAGQDSPLLQFLTLVRQQTDLPPPAPAKSGLLATAEAAGKAAAGGTLTAAAELAVPAAAPAVPRNWVGDTIRTPFAPLQALLVANGGQAPVLRVQNTMGTAYGVLSGVASAPVPEAAAQQIAAQVLSGQGADPLVALRVQAATLPRPVDGIFRQLHGMIWQALLGLTVGRIESAWVRDVAPVCAQGIARRYPFVSPGDTAGGRDVMVKDFAAFFGPNGTIDKFVTANLAMFTTPGPDGKLSLVAQNGLSLGLSSSALAQINRALAIRGLFFGSDGSLLLRYWLTPVNLDPRAMSAALQIDQTRAVYRHEPPRATAFSWPPTGDGGASLTLVTTGGETMRQGTDGAWAVFQLLKDARLSTAGNAAQPLLTFSLGGMEASYRLRAESVGNPFVDRDFMEFRCVPRL